MGENIIKINSKITLKINTMQIQAGEFIAQNH